MKDLENKYRIFSRNEVGKFKTFVEGAVKGKKNLKDFARFHNHGFKLSYDRINLD